MRVLIWSDSYVPLVGGGELFTLKTKEALEGAGFETHLATVRHPRIRCEPNVTPIPIFRINGVPIANPFALRRLINRFKPDCTLLIGPSTNNLLVAWALERKTPIVAHYLGDLSWNTLAGRILRPLFFRWLLPHSHHILTISESVKNSLAAGGIAVSRISSTKVGSEVELVQEPLQSKNGLVFVGGVGRSHSYKRPDLLLAALPALADLRIRLTLIGGGDAAWLEDIIRANSLSDRVTLLGSIAEAAKIEAVRSAKVLVLPSPTAQEGFGIVALEAMRLGTPVVVGERAGAAELVNATGFGATWSGANPADLAIAIQSVLDFSPARLAEGFARFVRISEDYTWHRVADLTVAAFADL